MEIFRVSILRGTNLLQALHLLARSFKECIQSKDLARIAFFLDQERYLLLSKIVLVPQILVEMIKLVIFFRIHLTFVIVNGILDNSCRPTTDATS